MAGVKLKIDGLKELDEALGQLPKATARAVLRKVLKEAGQPLAQTMRAKAPREEGNLIESIDVGTKLTKRQAALHRKEGGPKDFAEAFVGPNDPAGVQQEFGNHRHPPKPFARPAWDSQQSNVLFIISNRLGVVIEEAAKRLAKRARG